MQPLSESKRRYIINLHTLYLISDDGKVNKGRSVKWWAECDDVKKLRRWARNWVKRGKLPRVETVH